MMNKNNSYLGYGPEIDWWSLGVMLYELTYGRPPFHHECFEYCLELIEQADLQFPKDMSIISDYMRNFIAGVRIF